MKVNFMLEIPSAIFWPDEFGDGHNFDTILALREGYDSIFFYFEDYLSYTEIVDGLYIISDFEISQKVGDWLVAIKIFGSLGEVKAVACNYISAVKIIHKIDLIGPDGRDIVICYFSFPNVKKLA